MAKAQVAKTMTAFRVAPDVLAELRKTAEKESRTVSWLIEYYVKMGLRNGKRKATKFAVNAST